MTLEERIQKDLVTAMKNHQENALAALRSIKTAIQNEKTNGTYHELTDADVVGLIQKLVKQHKESMDIYSQAGRDELADKEQKEMLVLMEYVPKQLTEEEVEEKVKEIIAETGASSMKDMGKVMAAVMPETKGRADGKEINSIARALLG